VYVVCPTLVKLSVRLVRSPTLSYAEVRVMFGCPVPTPEVLAVVWRPGRSGRSHWSGTTSGTQKTVHQCHPPWALVKVASWVALVVLHQCSASDARRHWWSTTSATRRVPVPFFRVSAIVALRSVLRFLLGIIVGGSLRLPHGRWHW